MRAFSGVLSGIGKDCSYLLYQGGMADPDRFAGNGRHQSHTNRTGLGMVCHSACSDNEEYFCEKDPAGRRNSVAGSFSVSGCDTFDRASYV